MPSPDFIATRCTAHRNDLDVGGGRRSRDHTELLVSELELGVLWDEYGLVGDIVVCLFFMKSSLNSHLRNSHLQMTSLVPTSIVLLLQTSFTSSSRAPSKIIWFPGSTNTCYQSMAAHKQIVFLMILTAGMPFFLKKMLLCNDTMI